MFVFDACGGVCVCMHVSMHACVCVCVCVDLKKLIKRKMKCYIGSRKDGAVVRLCLCQIV